jgi:GNAT superfamily N-acetyltransferase
MQAASEIETITIRALTRADLVDVVAIDAALTGRSRRVYIERRLAAALREPAQHAQLAATDGSGLAGYVLARRLEGEFGRRKPALRLELIGVRGDLRGHGTSRRLLEALVQWSVRHGVSEFRTAASWRDITMLGWLDAMGFELAGDRVLVCQVADAPDPTERSDASPAGPDGGAAREINFGGAASNDFERLARDTADVRSMSTADLGEITRIDREITGRDRAGYMQARLAETMADSAIRVSLTARRDGAILGYLMARADLGDFGRTEPVAVIDTIGVKPDYARRGVGRAMLSQLFLNLGALRVERVETVIGYDALALLGFFQRAGFLPSPQLPFVRYLEAPR